VPAEPPTDFRGSAEQRTLLRPIRQATRATKLSEFFPPAQPRNAVTELEFEDDASLHLNPDEVNEVDGVSDYEEGEEVDSCDEESYEEESEEEDEYDK
jgi:hypothetical protein